MRRRVAGGALAALLVAGCFPGLRMRGTVREVPVGCGGADLAPGTPLEGARVTIRCPGDARPLLQAQTDAEGRFSASRGGLADHGCWMSVDKPGYTSVIYPLDHLCAVEGTVLEGCHAATLQAEIHPQPSSPAPLRSGR